MSARPAYPAIEQQPNGEAHRPGHRYGHQSKTWRCEHQKRQWQPGARAAQATPLIEERSDEQGPEDAER